jgi:hypothetical protein
MDVRPGSIGRPIPGAIVDIIDDKVAGYDSIWLRINDVTGQVIARGTIG